MKETSAGAVIFRDNGDSKLYLLLRYPQGHWDFVKGKMDDGESIRQTIIRESEEETRIKDLEFIGGFEEEIRYDFEYRGETINKKVIFCLARTQTKEITISDEHEDFVWLNFDESLKKTTYENSKSVLLKAEKLLASL